MRALGILIAASLIAGCGDTERVELLAKIKLVDLGPPLDPENLAGYVATPPKTLLDCDGTIFVTDSKDEQVLKLACGADYLELRLAKIIDIDKKLEKANFLIGVREIRTSIGGNEVVNLPSDWADQSNPNCSWLKTFQERRNLVGESIAAKKREAKAAQRVHPEIPSDMVGLLSHLIDKEDYWPTFFRFIKPVTFHVLNPQCGTLMLSKTGEAAKITTAIPTPEPDTTPAIETTTMPELEVTTTTTAIDETATTNTESANDIPSFDNTTTTTATTGSTTTEEMTTKRTASRRLHVPIQNTVWPVSTRRARNEASWYIGPSGQTNSQRNTQQVQSTPSVSSGGCSACFPREGRRCPNGNHFNDECGKCCPVS